MILKSFSKINLSLSVNKNLKNGLHEYTILFLFDKFIVIKLRLKKLKEKKDKVKFQGKFSKHIKKIKNSITNTLKVIKRKKIISNYYSVL